MKFGILATLGLAIIAFIIFSATGDSKRDVNKAASGSAFKEINQLQELVLEKRDFGVEGMVIRAQPNADQRQKMMSHPIVTASGKSRLLAHISTDKPFYKANEVVFIEVFLADSLNKTPKSMPAAKKPTI